MAKEAAVKDVPKADVLADERPSASFANKKESSLEEELQKKSSALDVMLFDIARQKDELSEERKKLQKKAHTLQVTQTILREQMDSFEMTKKHQAESNLKEKKNLHQKFLFLQRQAESNQKKIDLIRKEQSTLSQKKIALDQREKDFAIRVTKHQIQQQEEAKDLEEAWKQEKEFAHANLVQKRKLDLQNASLALAQIAAHSAEQESLYKAISQESKELFRTKKDSPDDDNWEYKLYSWKQKKDTQQLLTEIPLSEVVQFFFPGHVDESRINWVGKQFLCESDNKFAQNANSVSRIGGPSQLLSRRLSRRRKRQWPRSKLRLRGKRTNPAWGRVKKQISFYSRFHLGFFSGTSFLRLRKTVGMEERA